MYYSSSVPTWENALNQTQRTCLSLNKVKDGIGIHLFQQNKWLGSCAQRHSFRVTAWVWTGLTGPTQGSGILSSPPCFWEYKCKCAKQDTSCSPAHPPGKGFFPCHRLPQLSLLLYSLIRFFFFLAWVLPASHNTLKTTLKPDTPWCYFM